MICIAYLHGSSLARCKSANLIAEGPLVKLTIAVVVGTTTLVAPIFLVLCLGGFPSAH